MTDDHTMLRPRHVSGGDYLLIPRTTHTVLTFVVITLGLVLWVPSLFLMKKSFVFYLGYSQLVLAIGLLLVLQVMPRNRRRFVEPLGGFERNVWLRIPTSSDILLANIAWISVIACAAGGAMLTSDVINCVNQAPESLAVIVFGADLNATAVTDWTTQYRRPYFATDMLTQQSCRDDVALTIFYIVLFLSADLVMIAVAVVQGRARDWTLEVLVRQERLQSLQMEAKQAETKHPPGTGHPSLSLISSGGGSITGQDATQRLQHQQQQSQQLTHARAVRIVRIRLAQEVGIRGDDGSDADDASVLTLRRVPLSRPV